MKQSYGTIRIAVCDDSRVSLDHITDILQDFQTMYHMSFAVQAFDNGHALLDAFSAGSGFDICILDILMPGFSGMDCAREIRQFDHSTKIIFLTSSPEYALESYAVKAADYVLKPIIRETMFDVLSDVIAQLSYREGPSIVVRSEQGIQKIILSNLMYVEAMGKKTVYHLFPDRTVTCREKFAKVCDNLCQEGCFLQSHRSYVLNMNCIDRITGNDIILSSGHVIPIAQGRAKEIRQMYLAFQMEEKS
ncbi:MAG: LytR/AlgR family response regulator transcription factor [Bulleidia sp.]